MPKLVIHYADIEFETKVESVSELLDELTSSEPGFHLFAHTDRGQVGIVIGPGIPVYVTEPPDRTVQAL